MAGLHFDVTGDNSNFLRKLEETKRGVAETAKFMESQGKKIDSSFNSVSFGDALKKQIHEGAQSVNGLTAQIIKQKSVIKDIEGDVRALGEAYRKAGAGTQKGNALFADFKSAKASLQEEKNALFGLQTEQAQARLSVRKLKDEYSLYQKEGQNVVDSNNQMAVSFKKTLAAIGGIAAFKQLGSAIIEARAEMQQLEKSFEVLLGSKAKSDVFVKEMKDYALISPLSTTEVSKAAQTFLGFGVSAEKVIPTLKMIGDVSMGNSQRFSSLALAFAQVQAAGKLTGNDLLQLVNAGFNPLKIISEKTGKSMADLKKEMSDGSISADMVADAFKSATEAGGQFHGMIEKNADGIRNAQNVLQGAIQETLNKIGEQNEGLIKGGYEASTYLVENYREIGQSVTGLVGIYGTYRTALLINSVLELGSVKAVWAKVTATKAATLAQATYNKVLAMNPYVAVGMAVVSLGVAMWALRDSTSAAEKAQKRFNEDKEEAIKREAAHKSHIESLISTIQDETTAEMNRIGAMEQLKSAYPHIFAKYVDEKGHLRDIIGYKKEIEEFDAKVSVGVSKRQADRAKQELIKVNKEINYRQGSTTGASKFFRDKTTSELREMQSELLESYQLKQSDYDKLAELEAKAKEKLDSATVKQDKSYWEKQKKDAQSQLDALTDIEAAGKKGATLKDQINDYDKKINAFSASKTASQEKKEESAAEKLRKQNEKLKELSSKQSIEQERTEENLQNQLAQSKINAMANGFDRVQAQRELDNKKEIQALERQKDDYIRAYIQAQKELFNAEEDLKAQKDKSYKKRTFNPSSVSVNTSGFDAIISNTKTKQNNDPIAQQESDWNEYIIKYGTFLQKKQAITEKYNKLINEADTSGKAALLQKEMEEALSGLSVDKLKKEINWEVVFGDMSKVAKKQLQEVKRQLTELKKSDEFKNATPEQIKVIEEALDKINSALVDKSGFFGGLGDSLEDYKTKLEEAKKAQEEYDEALKTGNQALVEKATENRNAANANATNAGTNVEKSGDKAVKNINAVSNAIVQLGKKDVSLTDIGNTVGALIDTLGKSGSMIGGIISAILSIVDAAGEVGTFQYGMDLIGNVATKVTDAFARDTEAITGIDMSFMRGADYDDYNELKEQYETINSIWNELIDKKTEYLEIGTTEERKRTEGEILDLIGKQEQAYRNLGLERLNAGSSAGSHSIGVRIKKGMSDEGWEQVKSALGEELYSQINDGRMEKLFSLSSEQLEKLKGSAPDFWAKLDDDVRKYLDDIIKCGEQTEETIKKSEELWAGMSFDSMVDQFKSALSDMDSSTADFADDFQQYMINAMIDSFINGEVFQKKLNDWHKKLAEYSESDKKITEEEKDILKNDWDAMVQEGLDYRNNLFESMGFSNSSSSSQNSTNGGFQTMSQDEGKELNGRFTAFQISNEEIKNAMLSMLISVNLISVSVSSNSITLIEIRNIMISSNSYLEDIAKYTKELIGLKQTIANIENSAKAMAGK